MMARLFTIKTQADKKSIMLAVWEYVGAMLEGGGIDITISRMSKSRAQERKYHVMMQDIAKQIVLDGEKFEAKTWKVKLLDQFQQTMLLDGNPLSKPGGITTSLDGLRLVQYRPESSDFRVKEASDFIEYLFSFGAEFSINWTDPETQNQYEQFWRDNA